MKLIGNGFNSPELDSVFEGYVSNYTNIAVGGELVLVQYVLSDALAAARMWRIASYLNKPIDKTQVHRVYAERSFEFVENELTRLFPGTSGNIDEIRANAFIVLARENSLE